MSLDQLNNTIANDILFNILDSKVEYSQKQLWIMRECILKGLVENKENILKEVKTC